MPIWAIILIVTLGPIWCFCAMVNAKTYMIYHNLVDFTFVFVVSFFIWPFVLLGRFIRSQNYNVLDRIPTWNDIFN